MAAVGAFVLAMLMAAAATGFGPFDGGSAEAARPDGVGGPVGETGGGGLRWTGFS